MEKLPFCFWFWLDPQTVQVYTHLFSYMSDAVFGMDHWYSSRSPLLSASTHPPGPGILASFLGELLWPDDSGLSGNDSLLGIL